MSRLTQKLLPIAFGVFAIFSFIALFNNNQQRRLTALNLGAIPFRRKIEDGTVFAVINTPKCGTTSLHVAFAESLKCSNTRKYSVERVTINTDCEHGGHVIRTHDVLRGIHAIETVRTDPQKQKCVVTTAIRHPMTWLPSLFMQASNRNLCDEDMSYEEFFQEYHNFIMTRSRGIKIAAIMARPSLLKMFGTDVRTAVEIANRNGGFSIHNALDKTGPMQNCELLFLNLDDHNNWSEVLGTLYPGVKYGKHLERKDLCPKIADHYKRIQNHRFTDEERKSIVGENANVADYLRAFNL